MNRIKKILTIILCLVFIVTFFSGCKDNGKKEVKKGRYVEEECSIPNQLDRVIDIKNSEDDGVLLLAQGNLEELNGFKLAPLKYFKSLDLGKTWEEIKLNLPNKNGENIISYSNGIIMEDGNLLLNVIEYTPEDIKRINEGGQEYEYKFKLVIVDKEGNIKEIPGTEELEEYEEIKVDSKGRIYLKYKNYPKIVQFDLKAGKIKNIFEEESKINEFALIGNILVISNFENVNKYNIETGEKEDTLKSLKEIASKQLNYYSGIDNETIYMVGKDGVYSYKLGNEVLEKLIEGTLFDFGDLEYFFNTFLEVNQGEFLAVFSKAIDNKILIKHYYFSDNAINKIETNITVYSLYENNYIRQYIITYQKEHPNVCINLEIGIDDDLSQSITKEDAIKALNTKIMAGKGPDIINLSNLPMDSYIDKGVLEDLSDVIDKNREHIFTNILNYTSKDKKVYSIPTSFNIYLAVNKIGKDIQTLSEFANEIDSIKENFNGDIVYPINADEILYYFYGSCADSFLKEDKSLNKEEIKKFLKNIKIIYEKSKDYHTDISIREHDEKFESWEKMIERTSKEGENKKGSFEKYIVGNYANNSYEVFYKNSAAFQIVKIINPNDIMNIFCGKRKYNISIKSWNGIGKNTVEPNILIGISSKSKNKEVSKDIINEILTEKYQKLSSDSGIPINKNSVKLNIDTLNHLIGTSFWDCSGNNIEIEYSSLTDNEFNELIKLIKSCNGWNIPDENILDNTIEEMTAYVEGKASIDDTISKIEDKLKIYLSE